MVLNFLKSSFSKVKQALTKTRARFSDRILALLGKKIDEDTLEELEKLLFEADLGARYAEKLTKKLADAYKQNRHMTPEEMIALLKSEIHAALNDTPCTLAEAPAGKPLILLIVGVNGNGKTTFIAKLAKKYVDEGKKVLIAAGDTFRAAAIDQLEHWAERVGADLVKGKPGSDPAAVAYDAAQAAVSRGVDLLLIDTAGRLHTKSPLMQELNKIRRSCEKVLPGSPHETLLVLDATTGQNGVDQAKTFHQYTPITGLVLSKLDGTAKGGVVVAIHQELNIPVKFIGVGEGADDLEPFSPDTFVEALF